MGASGAAALLSRSCEAQSSNRSGIRSPEGRLCVVRLRCAGAGRVGSMWVRLSAQVNFG
jgi:hypothetical protein